MGMTESTTRKSLDDLPVVGEASGRGDGDDALTTARTRGSDEKREWGRGISGLGFVNEVWGGGQIGDGEELDGRHVAIHGHERVRGSHPASCEQGLKMREGVGLGLYCGHRAQSNSEAFTLFL